MFLYIQTGPTVDELKKVEKGEKTRSVLEKRTTGVYVRLTQKEQNQLKSLSEQSGVSVSALLRTGALGQLDQLPRFRKLPTEITGQLAKLDRLTTALWYISQQAGKDEVYTQDIRAVVYETGLIVRQVNEFCQANMARFGTIALLDELISELSAPDCLDTMIEVINRLRLLREAFKTGSTI